MSLQASENKSKVRFYVNQFKIELLFYWKVPAHYPICKIVFFGEVLLQQNDMPPLQDTLKNALKYTTLQLIKHLTQRL